MLNQTRDGPSYARLSVMPAIASILVIVLCFSGCASTRKTVKETSRTEANRMVVDSMAKEVLLVRRRRRVRTSGGRLAIPADSLMKLPPKHRIAERAGRRTCR